MNFRDIQARLLTTLRDRVRNGDLTERGLARLAGMSQPHMHNVLKGIRAVTPEVFDSVLKAFNLSLLDLCLKEELEAQLAWRGGPHLIIEAPFLESPIGPGMAWPKEVRMRARYPVPLRVESSLDELVLVRLAPDQRMRAVLGHFDLAALDLSKRARTELVPEGVYAVEREGEAILRYLRFGTNCLYALAEENMNLPDTWQPVQLPDTGIPGVVRARAIWVGRERNRHLPPHQRGRFLADATSR